MALYAAGSLPLSILGNYTLVLFQLSTHYYKPLSCVPPFVYDALPKAYHISCHALQLFPALLCILAPHPLSHPFTFIQTQQSPESLSSLEACCKMAATYSPAGVQYHRRGRA